MNFVKEIDYMLKPGYIYFSRQISIIRTVVGSCVAVCLWDKMLKFGGMNHFLYPVINEKSKATAQYGNVATTALVRLMHEAGSEMGNLVAQIFGGGYMESTGAKSLGDENILIAREILLRRGIKVASEDVGGTLGRKIVFDTSTGHVVVFKVHEIRKTDWLHG
jgi:chemotaxis protein CheD